MKRSKSKTPNTENDQIILALDPATKTGWAINKEYYGLWSLDLKKDESNGIRLLRFRNCLQELCKITKPIMIGYEKPGGRNYCALVLHSKLVGEIEKFCIENSIESVGYSASAIKKFATGNGNAGKPLMIKAAQEKLDYPGKDDNEADALWLLHLIKNDFKFAIK